MTGGDAATHSPTQQALRRRVLDGAMAVSAIVLPFIGALILAQAYIHGALGPATVIPCLYSLAFPALWLLRARLSVATGGVTFLALMLLMAFVVQLRGGLTVAPATLQLVVLILAGLLFGHRGVAVTLAINLLSYAAAGYAVLSGITPPISHTLWDPSYPMVWIRGGLVLTLFGGATAVLVSYVVARLASESDNYRVSLLREQSQRDALRRAEKEKDAARAALADAQRVEALGRLASGIAHDFNNSLTVISGAAELLELESPKSATSQEALAAIRSATTQAASMTQSLLALTRRDPARLAPVRTADLLDGMSASLGRLLPADIRLNIVKKSPAWVLVDRTQAERALINLVINARDAVAADGDIEIGCDRVALGSDGADTDFAHIWVRDNGPGISDEVKSRMFDPFFTTKRAGRGSGLGMALVRGFVVESGGQIDVDSAPGRGTTISLYLPVTARAPSRSSERAGAGPTLELDNRDHTVLLVEDNEQVLATAARTLRSAGFNVITAGNGDEALAVIADADRPFDLMCIDGVIPGASSALVIQRLQSRRPGVPIIVSSGYIEEELVLRGIRTGDLAYLRKPYRGAELVTVIRALLAGVPAGDVLPAPS